MPDVPEYLSNSAVDVNTTDGRLEVDAFGSFGSIGVAGANGTTAQSVQGIANGVPQPVQAAATRATVQTSAAQTAGGNSASVAVAVFREYLLLLNITAVSGTTPSLQFFVDASSDGGTTWFQIASGAAITAVAMQAIPLGAGASATPALFGDTIRLRWTITGTTPSFTFSAVGIGK